MQLLYQNPAGVPPSAGWARGAAKWAIIGVALSLLVSANLLVTLGVPYSIPSGSFFFKLHPCTYAILGAFLWVLTRGNPFVVLIECYRRSPAYMAFAGVVMAMLLYSLVRNGPSGSAFLIDTLLTPALLAMVLDQTRDVDRRRLFAVVVAIMTANAAIGVGEAILQMRVVPYLRGDQPMIEDYFRSTALSGHPLSNSLRTLVVMLCLPVMKGRYLLLCGVILFCLGLLAFGSRTGLVLAIVLGGIWLGRLFRNDLQFNGFRPREHGAALIVLAGGVLVAAVAVVATNLGQRIFESITVDDSVSARFLVMQAFGLLSSTDLWVGISPQQMDAVLFILKRTTTITDIENIWLLFIMQFGIMLTVMFAVSFAAFLWALLRNQPFEVWLAMVAFVVFIFSNNSLASKSQDFVLLVGAVMGAGGWASTDGRVRRRRAVLEGTAPVGVGVYDV